MLEESAELRDSDGRAIRSSAGSFVCCRDSRNAEGIRLCATQYGSSRDGQTQKALEQIARPCELELGRLGSGVRAIVRTGIPWLEITIVAQETDADLIITSTHGYTGVNRVFLGSTAERVVRRAPCPVLVVREREREFATLRADGGSV